MDAISSVVIFKSFCPKAEVSTENMPKKLALTTEVENVIKQLFHSGSHNILDALFITS